MGNPNVNEKESGASLKAKYNVNLKNLTKIPGTFHRENPSSFVVDLLWLGLAFLSSLILGADNLVKRRGTLNFAINANADNLDFSNIDPERVVKYMSEHVDKIREAIDLKNQVTFSTCP